MGGGGEPSQFADFYSAHRSQMLRFFARSIGDHDAAADLTSETFAKAYACRNAYRGHTHEEASAWLWRIARNELAGHWRRQSLHARARERLGCERPYATSPELERLEEQLAMGGTAATLDVALAALSPEQWVAVRMRVVDELSYAEIGAALGVSIQVVRARVSRGLRSLKHTVGTGDM